MQDCAELQLTTEALTSGYSGTHERDLGITPRQELHLSLLPRSNAASRWSEAHLSACRQVRLGGALRAVGWPSVPLPCPLCCSVPP